MSIIDLWRLWTCDDRAFETFVARVTMLKAQRIKEARGG